MGARQEADIFQEGVSDAVIFQDIKSRLEGFPLYRGSRADMPRSARAAFVGQRPVNIYFGTDRINLTVNMLAKIDLERFLEKCNSDSPDAAKIGEILSSDLSGDNCLRLQVNHSVSGLRITAKGERFGIEDIEAISVSPAVFGAVLSLLSSRERIRLPIAQQGDAQRVNTDGKRDTRELFKPGYNPRQVNPYKGYMRKKRRAHRK